MIDLKKGTIIIVFEGHWSIFIKLKLHY